MQTYHRTEEDRKEKSRRKRLFAPVCVLLLLLVMAMLFLFVSDLVKERKILINQWLVNEKHNTIGVDLSAYQADVDMAGLKSQGVTFVYIKATEGSAHQDSRFRDNWDNAQNAELLAGAYHFFSYDSPGDTQAENFIRTVGHDMTGRLIPAVDVEFYGDKEENPPDKDAVVRELSAFADAVKREYGVEPLIYTRPAIYEKYIRGSFDAYKIWMSSPFAPLRWNYKGDWYIWQYLTRGVLDGYSGGEKYIDLNVLNRKKSLDELIVR